MFVRKLALSNFAVRKMRVALTVSAIALSVSLVVAVTSGYASLEEAAFKFLSQYMGGTDATILRQNDPVGGVPENLVEELRNDPAVRSADGRLEGTYTFRDWRDPLQPKRVRVIGIARPTDRGTENQPMEQGAWFDSSTGDVSVVDQSVAELLKKKVGDDFELPGIDHSEPLKIVGIVHKPAVLAVHMHSLYLPLRTFQAFANSANKVSRILIVFRAGADERAFESRWKAKLHALDPSLS